MKRESYSRVATYIVTEACQNSESGNYVIEFEEVEKAFGIKLTEDIYNKVCERIMQVYDKVVVDIEEAFEERVFDINIYTDFLLNYDERGWGNANDDEDDENYFDAESYEEPIIDYSKMSLKEVIEKLYWSVSTNEKGIIIGIENWSPLGEDLYIGIYDDETIIDAIKQEYENYDADEHVAMLVESRGKNGVPNSISSLTEDAEAIEDMLYQLYTAINEWEKQHTKE